MADKFNSFQMYSNHAWRLTSVLKLQKLFENFQKFLDAKTQVNVPSCADLDTQDMRVDVWKFFHAQSLIAMKFEPHSFV